MWPLCGPVTSALTRTIIAVPNPRSVLGWEWNDVCHVPGPEISITDGGYSSITVHRAPPQTGQVLRAASTAGTRESHFFL